jgi:hypothetical protein
MTGTATSAAPRRTGSRVDSPSASADSPVTNVESADRIIYAIFSGFNEDWKNHTSYYLHKQLDVTLFFKHSGPAMATRTATAASGAKAPLRNSQTRSSSVILFAMNRIAENRAFRRRPEFAPIVFLLVPMLVLLGLVVPLFGEQQAQTSVAANMSGRPDQGCVNQGSDRRFGGTVVCWAQRHLSWKSQHEPAFVLIGSPQRTSVGLAWPPYLVYNSPDRSGRWRMFRIGVRYDRMWRGYIFPTAAWKRVSNPLRY